MSEPEDAAREPASGEAVSTGDPSPGMPEPPPIPEPPGGGGPSGGPGTPGGTGSDNRTLMVVLSYLWILALIPLLMEEDDPEVRWHARHGLVLTAAEIAFWLIVMGINTISGCLGCMLMPLYAVAWLATLGLHIACMVKGVKGERLIIPWLSQYADRF